MSSPDPSDVVAVSDVEVDTTVVVPDWGVDELGIISDVVVAPGVDRKLTDVGAVESVTAGDETVSGIVSVTVSVVPGTDAVAVVVN